MFQGDKSEIFANQISSLKASKLSKKGYQGYLAYVMNRDVKPVDIQMIPVVRKFLKIFPKELLGLPP